MELGKLYYKVKDTKDIKEITIFEDGYINIQTYPIKNYWKKLWYEWRESRQAGIVEEDKLEEEMMPHVKSMFEYYNQHLKEQGDEPVDYEVLLTKNKDEEDIDLSYIG